MSQVVFHRIVPHRRIIQEDKIRMQWRTREEYISLNIHSQSASRWKIRFHNDKRQCCKSKANRFQSMDRKLAERHNKESRRALKRDSCRSWIVVDLNCPFCFRFDHRENRKMFQIPSWISILTFLKLFRATNIFEMSVAQRHSTIQHKK